MTDPYHVVFPEAPPEHGRRRARSRNAKARRRNIERLVLLALVRQGWACLYCGRPLMLATILRPDTAFWTGTAGLFVATAEHLVPRSVGGPDDEANVAASCVRCNNERADNPRQDPDAQRAGKAVLVWQGRTYVKVGRRRWIPADGQS